MSTHRKIQIALTDAAAGEWRESGTARVVASGIHLTTDGHDYPAQRRVNSDVEDDLRPHVEARFADVAPGFDLTIEAINPAPILPNPLLKLTTDDYGAAVEPVATFRRMDGAWMSSAPRAL